MRWMGKVRDYIRSARDIVIGKSVEKSVEDNNRADAVRHDNEIEKAKEKVRRLEQKLNEARAELVRKQRHMDRFEQDVPAIEPAGAPVKREAKYFLKKWRKTCLWYGSIVTPVVAALWFCVLFVNWGEWWRIWPKPAVICPIKIFMRLLEYSLLYMLVRLSFCWVFFQSVYRDASTRDDVYMKLDQAKKWRFARAFWNNAVLSTINFYRGVLTDWRRSKDLLPFVKPGIRYLYKRVRENVRCLFAKDE